MTISLEDRVAFLQQRQMFNGVDYEFITGIAEHMEEYSLKAGQVLFKKGNPGSVFYIIYKGCVRVWDTTRDGAEIEYGVLEAGDKIGEESLITGQPRDFNVTALEDTTFLSVHAPDFKDMLEKYPSIEQFIVTLMESRHKARKMHFHWMNPGEIDQIITRRHPIRMVSRMVKPLLLLLFGFILILFSYIYAGNLEQLPRWIGLFLGVVSLIWLIWAWLDWLNDYYILTNQRVIWLEKTIFQDAARVEAPLSAVQSVDVKTSQIGRILDYGDVLVRTFTGTGSMRLTQVHCPKQFKGEIEDLLLRVRQKTEDIEEQRVRESIRNSLGLEANTSIEDPVFYLEAPEDEPTPGFKILRTREVSDGGKTITYHRHWWILLSKTWMPILFLITLLALMLTALTTRSETLGFIFRSVAFFSTWFIGILVCFGLIGYHFLDWYNDIYKITKDDMLIDSEKKPFGSEVSRSAPIKNIISLEHNRTGILRLLLNFGVVRVVVADETLIFYDVHNPAQVQQDIYYRQEQIKRKQMEREREEGRTNLSRWLRAYHEITNQADPFDLQQFAADFSDELAEDDLDTD